MKTFKVGHYVKVQNATSTFYNLVGRIAVDEEGDSFRYGVKFPDRPGWVYFEKEELEKISARVDVGDTASSQLEKAFAEFVETNTKTRSGYYDFPGGVEVRQISAHLTGFGAQALQYVARATRLDGKNKGDVVSDLTKAIDFIRWEIERLQGDSK